DIGKIGIPDSILLKPGRLDLHEVNIMKNHAEISVDIIRPLTKNTFFRHLVPGVRYHHERFDGVGYPIGLKAEKIPFYARIITVVDTVDAMLNTRPYRNALTMDHVKKELIEYSGTQFDPQLAQLYLASQPKWESDGQILAPNKDEVVIKDILRIAA
ncbi:MAG: HD domain-containing phosphohydrolase, partial [Bdellovibrionota bacterium]